MDEVNKDMDIPQIMQMMKEYQQFALLPRSSAQMPHLPEDHFEGGEAELKSVSNIFHTYISELMF